MFSLPSLPQQWEKRLIRYLLLRIDLLEERTLGDLSNLGGSVGRNSVFTLKDVGIKVEVRRLPHLPPPMSKLCCLCAHRCQRGYAP